MADYIDIRSIWGDVSNDGLSAKVDVAIVVAATAKLIDVTSTTAEHKWAGAILGNPKGESRKALMAVIAANKDATITQMQGALQEDVQAKVDELVDGLVLAYNA